jgi:hypothetical protein
VRPSFMVRSVRMTPAESSLISFIVAQAYPD